MESAEGEDLRSLLEEGHHTIQMAQESGHDSLEEEEVLRNRVGEGAVDGSLHRRSLGVEEAAGHTAAVAADSVPVEEEVLGYSSRPVEEGGSGLGEEDTGPAEKGDTAAVRNRAVGEVALQIVVLVSMMIDTGV